MADVLDNPRWQASCHHDLLSLLRQRLYGLALGYEDLNDYQTLRNDLALQTLVQRDTELASVSTLWLGKSRRSSDGLVSP